MAQRRFRARAKAGQGRSVVGVVAVAGAAQGPGAHRLGGAPTLGPLWSGGGASPPPIRSFESAQGHLGGSHRSSVGGGHLSLSAAAHLLLALNPRGRSPGCCWPDRASGFGGCEAGCGGAARGSALGVDRLPGCACDVFHDGVVVGGASGKVIRVKEAAPNAYLLKATKRFRFDTTVNVDRLRPYVVRAGALSPAPSEPLPGAAHDVYEAEAVLNHKFVGPSGHVRYLVHWRGYPSSEDTWEPAELCAPR